MRLALEGLSVGDAFGGRFFVPPGPDRFLPPPPWRHSDDTAMASVIVAILDRHGRIDQAELARAFARRYQAEPDRGYGMSVRRVLERIGEGVPWEESAREVFGGSGSMGNGGAMRVAPVGAYFADDLDAAVEQAAASAEVTHMHPEGRAGAIATAVAAAWASGASRQSGPRDGLELLAAVVDHTPDGATRAGLVEALNLGLDLAVEQAAATLGNGSRITSPDTVPFALWCAARHLDDFAEALWATASVGGDNDTNCAIVGGIVALACGPEGIPPDWRARREPLSP
jgi:ADP-ribosylglycohydrolase